MTDPQPPGVDPYRNLPRMRGARRPDDVSYALEAGYARVQGWYAENLAAGGVCDFCLSGDLDGAIVWITDEEVNFDVRLEEKQATVPYGRAWDACFACDEVAASGDVEALVERCWQGAIQGRGRSEIEKIGLAPEERARFNEETRRDLQSLMETLFAAGIHRATPEEVEALGQPAGTLVSQFPRFDTRDLDEEPHRAGPRAGWKDALEAQVDLWKFTSSPIGKVLIQKWCELETDNRPTKAKAYEQLLRYEEGKLLTVPPVYVDAEFCDLIEQAATSFKPESLLPEDLLMPGAFVYFARPIYLHDRRGKLVNCRAFSYQPMVMVGTDDDATSASGVALSLYSSIEADPNLDLDVGGMRKLQAELGLSCELQLLHLAPIWFNIDISNEHVDVDDAEETGFREWWCLFQVTLRLMLERIAARTQAPPERHARKRHLRAGFDPANVIVIRLRRHRQPHDSDEELGGSRDYSHRWIVSGHWRNQWYPSLATHRQRWIGSYVKGPEDKPLLEKKKVYQWDR